MDVDNVVKQLAETLEKEGNAKAVFAEPVKLEHHIIVPVAAVAFGGGGAGTSSLPSVAAKAAHTLAKIFGFGGGGGIDVRPVGFIHEREGEVVFTAIHVDGRGTPLVTEAANGIGKVVDTLAGIFTPVERKPKAASSERRDRPTAHA